MFVIRRIHDDVLPINRAAIAQVREIFLEHFSGGMPEDIEELPERLRNPFKKRFRTTLYVAENARRRVSGFAIVLHEPILKFTFLDYIATSSRVTGRGVGAALYEYVRGEALRAGSEGLFFECLPDEPEGCRDEAIRKANAARLRFYERYGAYPIVGTEYEQPVPGGSTDNLPHLMYDGLDRSRPPTAVLAKSVVRAVLERKYGAFSPPAYVDRVVASFRDPIRLRPPRHGKATPAHRPAAVRSPRPVPLVVNDRQAIHHIREQGYVESPVRIRSILGELQRSGLFRDVKPREYPMKHVREVHDDALIEYIRRACAATPEGVSIYPYVFPVRNATRPPKDLSVQAGYYCIDTFTPINRNAYAAAKRGVDCALTAADEILEGHRLAYALVRPPGHHAERRTFGGFCYFGNGAVAAQYLSHHGRVAILDIDYHHGNGQQDIFFQRADVFTVSIHGDPRFAYPYFTGFADETGEGAGAGFNLNLPLPEKQDGEQYRRVLVKALKAIADFRPDFLVVLLGLDPAKGDPTGTWSLGAKDFAANGRIIARFDFPTLVVQEGGYRTRTLGVNARNFFQGLIDGGTGR